MTKRSRRSRKALLDKLHVTLPPCALKEGTSRDYSFEPDAEERAAAIKQKLAPRSAELFAVAAGSLEEPPYAGLIGLLSEQMGDQL